MSDSAHGVIQFEGYRLVNAEFHCNPGFEFNELEHGEMKYDFAKASTSIGENGIQLNLKSRVFYSDKDDFDAAPYKVTVEVASRFSSETSFKKEWENNALAILFPYVRSIIGCITAQSGRDAVILPTVNIARMFEESEADNEELNQ